MASLCIPGTQMTSIFEGQPPKTRPKFQSKKRSFGFQVDTGNPEKGFVLPRHVVSFYTIDFGQRDDDE